MKGLIGTSMHIQGKTYRDDDDENPYVLLNREKRKRKSESSIKVQGKLRDNDIDFKPSNLDNIVIVKTRDGKTIHLSLIMRGYMVKYRYDGSAKWYTSYLSNVLDLCRPTWHVSSYYTQKEFKALQESGKKPRSRKKPIKVYQKEHSKAMRELRKEALKKLGI